MTNLHPPGSQLPLQQAVEALAPIKLDEDYGRFRGHVAGGERLAPRRAAQVPSVASISVDLNHPRIDLDSVRILPRARSRVSLDSSRGRKRVAVINCRRGDPDRHGAPCRERSRLPRPDATVARAAGANQAVDPDRPRRRHVVSAALPRLPGSCRRAARVGRRRQLLPRHANRRLGARARPPQSERPYAIVAQLDRAVQFGCPESGLALRMAELLCERMASVERVRFLASGTETNLLAIRLARAFTGRNKLAKARGAYHGIADILVVGDSSIGFDSAGIPAGVTPGVAQDVVEFPFNDRIGPRRFSNGTAMRSPRFSSSRSWARPAWCRRPGNSSSVCAM